MDSSAVPATTPSSQRQRTSAHAPVPDRHGLGPLSPWPLQFWILLRKLLELCVLDVYNVMLWGAWQRPPRARKPAVWTPRPEVRHAHPPAPAPRTKTNGKASSHLHTCKARPRRLLRTADPGSWEGGQPAASTSTEARTRAWPDSPPWSVGRKRSGRALGVHAVAPVCIRRHASFSDVCLV